MLFCCSSEQVLVHYRVDFRKCAASRLCDRRSDLTIEVSRRQLMASMGGVVLGSFALPAALRKALDNTPPSVLNSRSKVPPVSEIEHVVVLMQENRSFDHYFGAMPGVRGFHDPAVSRKLFYQKDPSNADGYLLPFHADTTRSNAEQIPSS